MSSQSCIIGDPALPGHWDEQLESVYAMSVEIAGLRQTGEVMDRALAHDEWRRCVRDDPAARLTPAL